MLGDWHCYRGRVSAGGNGTWEIGLRHPERFAALVAAGMSNRQIAQELALSESTVAKHLTSIFNKTASENRAAAAFAIRHDLA